MTLELLTITFAIISGYLESFIFHVHVHYATNGRSKSKEIHNALVILRVFTGVLMFHLVDNYFIEPIACAGLFFYFHQSSLYYFRNKLNRYIYTLGWNSDGSDTSESYWDIKFPIIKKNRFRVFVLSFSILLLIINNLL